MPEAVATQAAESRRRTSIVATSAIVVAFLAVSIVFAAQTTWYFVFKMIHVGAAVLWVGGGLFIGRLADQVAAKVFPLMSFVVLGFGFAMTANGNIGYNQFWIIFGLAAWAASAATGILFLTPETKRLTSAMTARGPKDPEVQMRLRRILLVLRIDIAVMLLIVFDMVVKPFS